MYNLNKETDNGPRMKYYIVRQTRKIYIKGFFCTYPIVKSSCQYGTRNLSILRFIHYLEQTKLISLTKTVLN